MAPLLWLDGQIQHTLTHDTKHEMKIRKKKASRKRRNKRKLSLPVLHNGKQKKYSVDKSATNIYQ